MEESDDDVTFIVKTLEVRTVRVPHIDANEIRGRAITGEMTGPDIRLLRQLDRALLSDDLTVTVDDEPMRLDLLDILRVIEDDGLLSEGLRQLREALRDPIVGGRF